MSTEQIVKSLWLHHARGDHFPDEWRGKLDLDQAYRAQLGLLDMKIARGEKQAGWKVGLTAEAMRELLGGKAPLFGHLLESCGVRSGHSFRCAGLRTPLLENELLITMGRDLSGPKASVEDARRAIATISPALELVEMRGQDMPADLPLAVADNVAQRAWVVGTAVPFDESLDFGAIEAVIRVNGETRISSLGREVIDNQLQTLAWLANTLHRFGRRLQKGQHVITGSFARPVPVSPGDTVEAEFSAAGTVSVRFV